MTQRIVPAKPVDTQRRYDLDWLRVAAVLLLIPFHGALTFNLNPYSVVYVKDTVESQFLIDMCSLIHQFHMPLLFAIAGASTFFALQKRRPGDYLVERVKRLLIPAFFTIMILVPPMTYISRLWLGNEIPFLQHYTGFFRIDPNELTGIGGTFTPGHVWFILYLFLFSVIGLPVFLAEKRNRQSAFAQKAAAFFVKPFALYLFLIPLSLGAGIDLLGDKNPIYYFGTFLLGYLIMTDARYQKAVDREAFFSLALGVVLFVGSMMWKTDYSAWSAGWIGKGLMEQGVRLFLLFGLLGIGHRLIIRGNQMLDYLSRAAFPFYLLHFVILTTAAYLTIQLNTGVALKYIIMVAASTLITFAVYEILRRIRVFRFLLGIK